MKRLYLDIDENNQNQEGQNLFLKPEYILFLFQRLSHDINNSQNPASRWIAVIIEIEDRFTSTIRIHRINLLNQPTPSFL